MKWADKIGAIDLPDVRKVHTQAIPRVGGIAMVAGSIVSILFVADLDQQVVSILLGFLVIWIFGLWDDRCDLNYKIKFLGQLMAIIIVVTWGDVIIKSFPFYDGSIPDYLAIPFTIFALIGITNAINLSDGLDGLAGGITLISISMIALLAYDAAGEIVVIIAMAVAGSILGFLRHNTYPARLFMGDTGSQFLGFSLGVIVIVLSQSINSAMSPLIPLMILGLPILDTIAVMSQRIYQMRSPFSPDKNHIHHKLLALGLDHYEAVLVIYLLQSTFVAIAYFMLYESDMLLSIIYLCVSFSVLAIFHIATISSWRRSSTEVKQTSRLKQVISYLRNKGILVTVPTYVLSILVPLLLLIPIVFSDKISMDLSVLAMLLLIMLLTSIFLKSAEMLILEKAVFYITSVLAMYQLSNLSGQHEITNVMNVFFIVIAIAFALRVRFSYEGAFQVTPLDYLVVVLVVVIPNLPESHLAGSSIGEMAVKLIVLFYAGEAIMGMGLRMRYLLRIGMASTLFVVAARIF